MILSHFYTPLILTKYCPKINLNTYSHLLHRILMAILQEIFQQNPIIADPCHIP